MTANQATPTSTKAAPQGYRWTAGDVVNSRVGGNPYRIIERLPDHPRLKGAMGYRVVGLRNGQPFGPLRVMRQSAMVAS